MIDKFLTKVFGSSNQRFLKAVQPLVHEINAKVETEAASPQRASEMAHAYNGMLVLGQFTAAAKGKDEEVLYRNTQVTSEEKKILVNFSMPRQTASEMLKKQLTKAG